MGRRRRVHIVGGTYYVVQQGNVHHPIFSQPEDYALFERLLADSLRRTNARAHAHCWMPHSIHLILQIDEIPVGRFMQSLTSCYARLVRRRIGPSGDLFPRRYRAALTDPQSYLLKLLHYLHYLPVLGGLAESLGAAAYTSHAAYSRQSASPWLTTNVGLGMLEHQKDVADYDEFMQRRPEPEDIEKFERAGSNDLPVIGSPEFMKELPWYLRTHPSKASLDQIINTVTCRMGVERDLVLSKSQQREYSLAHALIAWYATVRGVATLSEVAHSLRRDPSTLSTAVRRYRARRPELFKITSMPDISPLVPIGSLPRTHDWNWQLNTGSSTDSWSNANLRDAAPVDSESHAAAACTKSGRV